MGRRKKERTTGQMGDQGAEGTRDVRAPFEIVLGLTGEVRAGKETLEKWKTVTQRKKGLSFSEEYRCRWGIERKRHRQREKEFAFRPHRNFKVGKKTGRKGTAGRAS